MLDFLANISIEIGSAAYKLLPKSIQQKADPNSPLGYSLGLVLGISLVVIVAVIIGKVI